VSVRRHSFRGATRSGAPRILIVEDEEIIAEDLGYRLRDWGYEVVGLAHSSDRALELAREHRPDLVLMDIVIQGTMDGIETGRRIQMEVDASLVYVTAFADRDTLSRARITSPIGYVLKPFQDRELRAVVELALTRHKARIRDDQTRQTLRLLAKRLQDVREEESVRVSRRIHDELGQLVTVLKFDVAWLDHQKERLDPDLQERLTQVVERVDAAAASVRQIAGELRPGVLDDLGLLAAVEWMARDFGQRTGARCIVHERGDLMRLDGRTATAAFRICQEALSNIAKHAQATSVEIHLERRPGGVYLEITDNGCGIKREALRNPASMGLIAIRERARAVGGRCSIAPMSGGGTRVRARLFEGGGMEA